MRLVATGGMRRRRVDRRPRTPRSPGRDEATARLLERVVDPWRWPRAAGATARERALEDIGPYEIPPDGQTAADAINSNADYWTRLASIAWDRDVDVDFRDEPVDLDGDGVADARVTRRVRAPGGILANPELFGLTRTPDDPRGHVGRISVSTGVLGLREALRPDGRPSGQIGMTCFVCHGSTDPVDGRVVLGLPGTRFDYGLLLATSALLADDERAVAARRARGFPSGRAVRARLLFAGPGRQDLTGEFGLDVTVPGYHSARYAGTKRVRQGIRGIVNPISVPAAFGTAGLSLQNWSGSEDGEGPWLDRLIALAGRGTARGDPKNGAATLAAFGLPAADLAAARRALLLDQRNRGTHGLQKDSFPGLLWADAIYGYAAIDPGALAAIPRMYVASDVRRVLADAASAQALPRPPITDATAVARGRALFSDRVVGVIANRQILKSGPRAYAAAHLAGPILAPIDASRPLDAKLPVRCADCHNAAPLDRVVPLGANPPPLGRCVH